MRTATSAVRRQLATSPIARGAAMPLRAATITRHNGRLARRSLTWLVRERETTNYTYDLSALNRDQLCWFVSAITDAGIAQVRLWMRELEEDQELIGHITSRLASNPRRRICATQPRWARRFGWYALIRATQPDNVIETGTHLGLGSCVISAALLRNGHGQLTTIDVDPDAGYLIGGRWASVIEQRIESSVEALAKMQDVDLFLHDSLHTYEYETQELEAVAPNLTAHALTLSDNSHDSSALSDWAERPGRHFLFFKEQPQRHWWPGDGIGASWAKPVATKDGSNA